MELPRSQRVVANYQNASIDQLKHAIAIQKIVDQYPGIHRRNLAAEYAGAALEKYPDICNRCVLTSSTPSRTKSLIEEIHAGIVPTDCWKQLIDEGLFDERCADFLL